MESEFIHLRSSSVREWSDYSETPQGTEREIRFLGDQKRCRAGRIRLRQEGVKQTWRVRLNDQRLGELVSDEKDQFLYLPSRGHAQNGRECVQIEPLNPKPATSDDIRVGQIALDPRPRMDVLSEATLEVNVTDKSTSSVIPCRMTITNHDGTLQATGAASMMNSRCGQALFTPQRGRAPKSRYR